MKMDEKKLLKRAHVNEEVQISLYVLNFFCNSTRVLQVHQLEIMMHEEASKRIANKNDVKEVNPRHIRKGIRKYYKYMGSLSTPPCTEGEVWTLIELSDIHKYPTQCLLCAIHLVIIYKTMQKTIVNKTIS